MNVLESPILHTTLRAKFVVSCLRPYTLICYVYTIYTIAIDVLVFNMNELDSKNTHTTL